MPVEPAFSAGKSRRRTLAATYPGEDALAYLRGIRPDATLAYLPLTDWQFRLEPGATMPDELLTPIALASDGLGTGRLVMRLSTETGLVLEGLLRDDAAVVPDQHLHGRLAAGIDGGMVVG